VSGEHSQPQGDTAPTGEPVEESAAADVVAALEVGRWQMRHGPIGLAAGLNGHKANGHRVGAPTTGGS
jgi:hypothetical protein